MKYSVRVITNASRDNIDILSDDSMKIHITTIPEKGKANKRIIKLLSKKFNISKSKINIVSGELSSNKIIEIDL
ncbi:MAG: DUF167 domain-containing protein [Alphaproteobacteria bacterium]|jgi:uncharacterized protein (TIGR00251 family)|nr:DUF167 domain-containing protein [Alphaproteobacteria bacterium]MCV6598992.1 DUF167 domain-containing protein [Alphaproteobacteria bacterium]